MVDIQQGDILFVNLNPTAGHEQKGKRPVIVLSSTRVSALSNLYVVAPLSSTKREYPFYFRLESTRRASGCVLLDQTRSLDLISRGYSHFDRVSEEELIKIIDRYKLIFSIDKRH